MLKNKIALITGGSRGIGAAIAEKLASLGADIAVIFAGNSAAAEQVCHKCSDAYGVKALSYRCNVADFNQTKETVAAVKADFGTIDILVNNAGITRDGLMAVMKENDFDDVVSTNLKGAFNMIRHCSPIFIRNHTGKIINISSIAGIMGNAGQANYAASKAGLIGLTKSVAKELAARNITCKAIAPGFIRTDMTEALDEANPLIASIPLKRMGKPEDVAELAAFLALSAADYITGEVFRVDGGLAM
jgi:3-oxoacyl-[acyl-carrier protein] reductase